MPTPRVPSARVRRRLVRALPARVFDQVHAQYSAAFDLILRHTLAGLENEHSVVPDFVRVDASAEGNARSLWELFTYGLPIEIERATNRIFAQILSYADENVARALPGIAPSTFFPTQAVTALRETQVRKIHDAAQWQIDEVRKVLTANQGLHPRDLRKLLEEKTQASKGKATLWARDQTLKFNAAVTKQRHEDLGIKEYVWTTSADERVRDRHAEFADRSFKYSDPPLSDSGEKINPGEDYQCRCIAFPVTPSASVLRQGRDEGRIALRQARAAEILARRRPRR